MKAGTGILLLLSLGLPASRCGEYLEIKTELTATWESSTRTNYHEMTVTCIVGTNHWFMVGDFLRNGRVEYWLVGTNIAERTTITSSMYLKRAKDFLAEKLLDRDRPRTRILASYPPKGRTRIRVQSSAEPFGVSQERLIWLALCSGSHLGKPDREIPILLGFFRQADGYSDETVLLDGSPGLPKSVQIYAMDGQLAGSYEVLSTTNVLGLTLPLEFHYVQYGYAHARGFRAGTSKSIVIGKVTSIRIVEPEPIPEDVLEELEKAKSMRATEN